jgi:sulfur carrier protein ThiS
MPTLLRAAGMLKDYLGGRAEISVEPGQTVREMLQALKIPSEVVAFVAVNGHQQTKDYVLQEGDLIKILAVIGGG